MTICLIISWHLGRHSGCFKRFSDGVVDTTLSLCIHWMVLAMVPKAFAVQARGARRFYCRGMRERRACCVLFVQLDRALWTFFEGPSPKREGGDEPEYCDTVLIWIAPLVLTLFLQRARFSRAVLLLFRLLLAFARRDCSLRPLFEERGWPCSRSTRHRFIKGRYS